MNNKTYFCTLKPMNKFFFGGERTFGEEGANKTNYLVRSNPFPQQTTILGMIRFELLKQDKVNLLPISPSNEANVEKTIGKQSFKITSPSPDYGFIQKISPVFICNETEKMTVAPRDFVTYLNKEKELVTDNWIINNGADSAFLFGNDKIEIKSPTIEHYDHKIHYLPHFKNIYGNSVLMNYDSEREMGVFIADSQIGIKKNQNKKDDKGFYKQFYYRMNKGYAYGFYLETSKAISEQTSIVYMGADKSAFLLTINDAGSENFDTTFGVDTSKNGSKITLLSDAYVSEELYQNCDYALVDTVQFRNIETSINQTIPYHKKPIKSEKVLNLVARGSVLFPSNWMKVKEILYNENFIKIGYNIYKID